MNEVVREPDTAEGTLEPVDVFAAERLAMLHRIWYWMMVLWPRWSTAAGLGIRVVARVR